MLSVIRPSIWRLLFARTYRITQISAPVNGTISVEQKSWKLETRIVVCCVDPLFDIPSATLFLPWIQCFIFSAQWRRKNTQGTQWDRNQLFRWETFHYTEFYFKIMEFLVFLSRQLKTQLKNYREERKKDRNSSDTIQWHISRRKDMSEHNRKKYTLSQVSISWWDEKFLLHFLLAGVNFTRLERFFSH